MKTSYYALAPKGPNLKFPSRTIRFVQRDVRLRSFNYIFGDIAKNSKKFWNKFEGKAHINVFKILDKIIPDQYFGIPRHRSLFYKIVKLIISSSVYECIYVDRLLHGFNLYKVPWLTNILQKDQVLSKELKRLSKKYFFEAQLWLLDKIVKPLIFRFYSPIQRRHYELEFVPRRIWMSFRTKVFNHLCNLNHLSKVDQSLKPRGLLQIKPKTDYDNFLDFRPIMRLYTAQAPKTVTTKDIIKKIRLAAESMCKTETNNLFKFWKEYTALHPGRIYAAKIDVADAFGNINIKFLCHILEESSKLNQISPEITNTITNHIKNQVICFGKTKAGHRRVYQWNHGLLQGDRFSSVLCQFYLSYLDSIHLKHFYKEDCIIHRTVDDYFFCSTRKEDVEEFIKIMNSVHKINNKKTFSNLENYGHNIIPYCGHNFLLDTKQVTGLHDFKKRYEIRHRFRFWNYNKPVYYKHKEEKTIHEFLSNSMKFRSNSFNFKNVELNTIFNSEKRVLLNYFASMTRLAFKLDACIMNIFYKVKNFSIISRIIQVTVHKYARKTISILNSNQGSNSTGLLSLKIFLKLGFHAFQLVFKRRTQYRKHKMVQVLLQQARRISTPEIDFKCFRSIPACFNNISMQRRLPQYRHFK